MVNARKKYSCLLARHARRCGCACVAAWQGEIAGHPARRVGHEAGVGGVGARILAALREVAAQAGLEYSASTAHLKRIWQSDKEEKIRRS